MQYTKLSPLVASGARRLGLLSQSLGCGSARHSLSPAVLPESCRTAGGHFSPAGRQAGRTSGVPHAEPMTLQLILPARTPIS